MRSMMNAIGNSGRILIVTPQPFYEDRGTPIAVRYLATALSELGANVDLLAFPVGKDVRIANIHITRSANPLGLGSVPVGFSWRKLVLDAGLWQAFTRLLHAGDYQLVHAVEEAAWMAAAICPHLGVPFIYDMASAIPVEMSRSAPFRAMWMRGLLSRVERRVLHSASRVICSSGLAGYVGRQAPEANVREWLFPAFNERVDGHRAVALRMDLGLSPDQRVVLYTGNLASYQGLGLLLEAFDLARQRRPELVLVCVGATEKELRSREVRAWLERPALRLLPRQPREKMAEFLKLADFLVLPRAGVENVPLKLFDYMAAGKPIIATRGPAHEPFLNSSRGFMAAPEPGKFSAALVSACESPERAATVAQSAQAYARQHFGWDRFVEFVRTTYSDALMEVQELKRLVA